MLELVPAYFVGLADHNYSPTLHMQQECGIDIIWTNRSILFPWRPWYLRIKVFKLWWDLQSKVKLQSCIHSMYQWVWTLTIQFVNALLCMSSTCFASYGWHACWGCHNSNQCTDSAGLHVLGVFPQVKLQYIPRLLSISKGRLVWMTQAYEYAHHVFLILAHVHDSMYMKHH